MGASLWAEVQDKIEKISVFTKTSATDSVSEDRYGKEYLIRPRLGQGAFRVLVTEAYHRRCAFTGERTLPVLNAAHIKPYSQNGPTS